MLDKFELLEILIDNLGIEKTLEELTNALSDEEFKENFNYIARMYDIETEEE